MTASFGKLQGATLELKEGLNILQAPNETGKSTWCAFLLSMLYGINSRERDRAGFIADKNRYAPWDGNSMAGRLDCTIDGQNVTITRSTRRQTAPMGEFQAVYAGTGDPVPGLTGPTCGETLLGVSREVFERSAFIRQSGLSISQDPGLERRIAALVTSGEEDTSYSEAVTLLKKQLNRRRHNKTGQLPALEAELEDLRRQIDQIGELERQLTDARRQTENLSAQEDSLLQELAQLDRWEHACQRQALDQAQAEATQAQERYQSLRQRLEEENIPENDTIGRLRGAIVNLQTVRRTVEKAREERDEALKALLRAEAALNTSPFAGQTPEQVQRELQTPPAGKASYAAAIILGIAGAAATAAALWLGQPLGTTAALCLAAGILLLSAGGSWALARSARRKAQEAALIKRYGTADASAISQLADTYYKMYQSREDAQAEVDKRSATADAMYASLSSNEQAILLEVRRFAPAAFDISTADQLLRGCAIRRKELQTAEAAAREARLRWELLEQQSPAGDAASAPVQAPARSREAVTAQLETLRSQLTAARSAVDRLEGQLHADGDPAQLRSKADCLTQQAAELETEYDSLQLALEALDSANTTLQNRFAPALGRQAAQLFRALTEDRYTGVTLDRAFHLSAEPSGSPIYRDAALLSAGTLDQLYLAVRLAICGLVLPPSVPLVLDDALANFDDVRCAAALRLLQEEAQGRQILLFTCHSREAALLSGEEEVFVQQLTDAPEKV